MKSFKYILLLFILFVTACDFFNMEFNNPVDKESDSYQGFKTVADITKIKSSPESDLITSDTKLTFNWSSIAETLNYHIQISRTDDFTASILDLSTLTINSYSLTTTLSDSTSYYWHVKQKDKNGTWSNWSSTFNFSIYMDKPVYGTPSGSEVLTDTTPTLSWEAVTGATGYEVEINSAADFTGTIVETDNTITTNSYSVTTVISDNYFWRIKQKDINQVWSDWSITFNLKYYHDAVGEIGPAGGYIFYDDEADGIDDLPSFRYLEAAPTDASGSIKWGTSRYSVEGADDTAIGTGIQNTLDIITGDNFTTNAAHDCLNYSVDNNEKTFNDWFLPSKDELAAIYDNLKVNGLGGLSNNNYWSSSEYSSNDAWEQDFSTGVISYDDQKGSYARVRPVRAFNNLTIKEFTVSFNKNENTTGDLPESITGAFLSEVTIPGVGNLVMDSYLFRGWNTLADGTGTSYNTEEILTIGTNNLILYAIFSDLTVGDIGPSGGYIFYDDEADGVDDLSSFRYLEAAPTDIELTEWGSYNFSVSGADGTAIGTGAQNTIDIISADNSAPNAAHDCISYSVDKDGVTYDGWFLPSKDELAAIYDNLKVNDLGDFKKSDYWSSSSYESDDAWEQDFFDGEVNYVNKYSSSYSRPVRAFNNLIVEEFTVSFKADEDTTGDSHVSITGSFLSNITLPEGGNLVKVDQFFQGWNTSSDGSGTDYNVGDTFFIETANVSLFAIFKLPIVGVKGESGGYIFYDKGSYSDGWRYLEAAPTDASNTAVWGAYYQEVSGADGTAIGTGVENTPDIIAGIGPSTNAANVCADYFYYNNGTTYNDWFLPSKDELNAMYENLKLSDFGGFENTYYWSSSENSYSLAWDQNFDGGYSYGKYKDFYKNVRPIRSF